MRGLTLAEADRLRRTPGASVVLFLTDRCPVGCAHCSVSSTVDGPTIRDWTLFTELVEGIAALPAVRVVPITGGEPFTQRRGLTYAVRRLAAAGKRVVLFTSGFWARSGVPAWVRPVLAATDTVYLGIDSYHAAQVRDLAPAVAAVTGAGCHLVLQVLDEPGARAAARALAPTAEIRLTRLLPVGRGAALPTRTNNTQTPVMAACSLLHSPTVRYDGRVTACCHEAVIMGAGPASLHRRVSTAAGVAQALDSLRREPVLRLMARFGPGALSSIAPSTSAVGAVGSTCGICWAAQDRVAVDPVAAVSASILAGAVPAGAVPAGAVPAGGIQ